MLTKEWDYPWVPWSLDGIRLYFILIQGPQLFYVDSDGQRLKADLFSVGSGSTYAYGVLDSEYDYDMPVEKAIDLARRSIFHATFRDAYSGGVVNGL